MNPKVIFGLFVAVATVQLAVPVSQVWKHENILRTGRAYKFRTAPVDPYDAFRGRYVALNYADTQAPVRKGDKLDHHGQVAYVGLTEAADGFARFTELSVNPPASGDYLRVTYSWGDRFALPFDKSFMEESQAPQAEDAYRRFGNRRAQTNDATYVLVRVKGGRGVIENLYIKDQPIREFIRTMPK
jgi:uncharacterized membrane-anchored protein